MAATNAAALIATQMEIVEPRMPILFEADDTFFSTVERSADVSVVGGRDFRLPLQLAPGGHYGHYDPDGGDLGRGEGPRFDKGIIPISHLRIALEWTALAEWQTDDRRKSIINIFRYMMTAGMKEMRRHLDSACMTKGDGVLGTISAVTVNTPAGSDTITLNTDGFGARLLRETQSINVYNSTLATNRTAGAEKKITYIDYKNKQIRIPTGTAGIVAGDKIVVSGVSATPPVSVYGVPYYHNADSTGTWLGLDRATIPQVRGNRVNANSAGLALSFIRLTINQMGDRLGVENTRGLTAWMHPAQFAAYEELGMNSIVLTRNDGGGSWDPFLGGNLRMAGIPIRQHFSWDKTRIDFIVPSAWGRAELHPLSFYEVDGTRIWEVRGGSGGVATSMIYYLVYSWNLFQKNPTAGAFIDNLAVPAGY